jgi:hypothetical protein
MPRTMSRSPASPIGRLLLLCVVLALAGGSAARTWRVERDGTGNFYTLQPAVEFASPGDTILVGSGRYAEVSDFDPGKDWPSAVCVGISTSDLCIIGIDRDRVTIGPMLPDYSADDGPYGIVTSSFGVSNIMIANVTIENVYTGAFMYSQAGFENCRFRSCQRGVDFRSTSSLLVQDCDFDDIGEGVHCFFGSGECHIQDSQFINNDVGINSIAAGYCLVANCEFSSGRVGVGFQQGTCGTVVGCIIDVELKGLDIALGSSLIIQGCHVEGGVYCLKATAGPGSLIGVDNVLIGGSYATLALHMENVSLSNCHIIKTGDWAVRVAGPVWPPPIVYDLSNNYWGTDSPELIESWIYDSNDNAFILGTVDYSPFSDRPLGTEPMTWGGVKAFYR